jgi:hypothetical protein
MNSNKVTNKWWRNKSKKKVKISANVLRKLYKECMEKQMKDLGKFVNIMALTYEEEKQKFYKELKLCDKYLKQWASIYSISPELLRDKLNEEGYFIHCHCHDLFSGI